jgi:hypothetical protein
MMPRRIGIMELTVEVRRVLGLEPHQGNHDGAGPSHAKHGCHPSGRTPYE